METHRHEPVNPVHGFDIGFRVDLEHFVVVGLVAHALAIETAAAALTELHADSEFVAERRAVAHHRVAARVVAALDKQLRAHWNLVGTFDPHAMPGDIYGAHVGGARDAPRKNPGNGKAAGDRMSVFSLLALLHGRGS